MPKNVFESSIKEYLDKNIEVANMFAKQLPKIAEIANVIDEARRNGKTKFADTYTQLRAHET
ncbi:MAG: hypothetical protein ACHQX1_02525, partial [Candidatus Micrarchaeales archaeon]